jgi:hypothetical protein
MVKERREVLGDDGNLRRHFSTLLKIRFYRDPKPVSVEINLIHAGSDGQVVRRDQKGYKC